MKKVTDWPIMQDGIFEARRDVAPQIYVYSLPDISSHRGYLKIGYTDKKDWEERIKDKQIAEGGGKYTVVKNGRAKVVADVAGDSNPYEIEAGIKVVHKQYGDGTIASIDKRAKYIIVRFAHDDRKRFAYPNCFEDGHLKIKQTE